MSQTVGSRTVVRPFRALHYDPARVDPADVVAPPYDVIDAAGREALCARSPYNVVRLILPDEGREADVRELLDRWTAEGVLVRDAEPAAWWLEQEATGPDGVRRVRSGLIAALKVDPYGEGPVRPHERTLEGPKAGRLALMRAVGANLSPIFAIYDDPERAVTRIAEEQIEGAPPRVAIVDADGTEHRLWRIADPAALAAISDVLAPLPLVIADGHHRYETAVAYRAERRAAEGDPPGDRAYDFAPAYLANRRDPGLEPFATHRIVSGIEPALAAGLPAALAADWDGQDVAEGVAGLERAVAAAPRDDAVFGLWDGVRGRLFTLRDRATAAAALPHASRATQRLDVALLGALVLGPRLGLDVGAVAKTDRIRYRRSAAETAALVAEEPPGTAVALLLRAPTVAEVEAVADAGETMPQKSTYFYPKLLDGLVFGPMDD